MPTDESDERRPDLAVAGVRGAAARPGPAAAAAVLDVEPATVVLPRYESVPVAYLNIRRLPGRERATGVELLSPSNKAGRTRRDYLAKRVALLSTAVNLVEIDLLLGGRRPPVIGAVPAGDFCALVSRADERPDCQAYAWSIRRGLPRLPIPLRPGEDDVILDLAAAYAMTYDGGAFDVLVPYGQPLPGPLADADRAWAAERAAAGRGP